MDKIAIGVILTDLHLAEGNLNTVVSIYEQAKQFCIDNGIKTIFNGGDVFTSRKSQSQLILTTFERVLDDLHQSDIKMVSIVGNHDKTDYRSKDSFLSPFKHHPALTLIEECSSLNYDGLQIDCLSYFDEDLYLEYLPQLNPNKDAILFTHIGISGARMNNGTAIESSVTPRALSKYKSVLVGHYHDAQEFDNVNYIGASMQHNYGEGLTKGLQVLYNDGSVELFELDSPKYITYAVAVKDLTNKDLKDLEEEKKGSDNFIRIQLLGDEKDLKSFNIQSLKQVGVDVQIKKSDIEITELQNRIEPFTAETLMSQFLTFCEEGGLDVEQGLEYFKNAK